MTTKLQRLKSIEKQPVILVIWVNRSCFLSARYKSVTLECLEGSTFNLQPFASSHVSISLSKFYLNPLEQTLTLYGRKSRNMTMKPRVSFITHTTVNDCERNCFEICYKNDTKVEIKWCGVLKRPLFSPILDIHFRLELVVLISPKNYNICCPFAGVREISFSKWIISKKPLVARKGQRMIEKQ